MITGNEHIIELIPAYLSGSLAGDERRAVDTHVAACDECASELREWQAVAGATQAAAPNLTPSRGALDHIFEKIDDLERPLTWQERLLPAWMHRPAIARSFAGGAVAAVFALALAFTPAGLYAQRLLDSFQPKQFAVVPVTMADIQALNQLAAYGDVTFDHTGEPQRVDSAKDAAAATGIVVAVPSKLPAGVTAKPMYGTAPSASGTFTFRASKASETAARRGKNLPPLPSNIDGSSVQITTGAAVFAVYGGASGSAFGSCVDDATGSTRCETQHPSMSDMIPQLIVGQAFVPTATSNGASPTELKQYLLSLPGISPELSSALNAIGDPTTTWPIPVPIGKVETHQATVQGVSATVFAEKSGFGNGVLWVKNGYIYGVAGPLDESEIIATANSLQ